MSNTGATLLVGFISCVGVVGGIMTQPPNVQWSYSQDKCVKVEFKDPKYSCDNLPEKYTKVYVE